MFKRSSTEWVSRDTPNICTSLDAILLNAIPLYDQQQFRLNKINEIKDYFVAEIKERDLTSIMLSKCIYFVDYFDKSSIILSVTTDRISIASFTTLIGAPLGIKNASSSLAFSVSIGIVKKLLKTTQSKNKKVTKSVMLGRSKLDS